MVVEGQGSPIVLIPGIQGHWEWLRPAVTALAARYRVTAFSLHAIQSVFDESARLIDATLDDTRTPSTALIGVSFGGLLAVHYAATRPERVRALVLVATPGPRWDFTRAKATMAHPWLASPRFVARAIRRMTPEIRTALPTWPARVRFAAAYAARVVRHPIAPTQMVRWVEDWMTRDIGALSHQIRAPTLLVTGEGHLDRVVPPESTQEYLSAIPGSRLHVLSGTGHIGLVAKPREFARVVGDFLDAH